MAKKKEIQSRDSKWDSEEEKSVYDKSFYDADASNIGKATPFVRRFFLKELPKWDSCCDLGCGIGTWMKTLQEYGKDVLGIDFSDGSVETNVLGNKFLHADLTKPLNLGRTFDVVSCWEVLEHLPKDLHRPLFDNIKALKPKILVMSCAGMKCVGSDTGELEPVLEKQWGRHHYSCMTLREFSETMEAEGFVVDGLLSCLWRQMPKVPGYYKSNTLVFRSKQLQ